MIWKHPKYVEGRKFYELFDSKKIFGARALPRARAQNILPPMPKNHDFWVFTAMWDPACAARGNARAPKFFWKCNLHDKISLQIFLFGHNSKSEFFRAIWSLNFFWKIRFFPEILKISKFWKFSILFWNFHEKIQYSKASTANNLKDIRILKIPRIYRIDQRISSEKNFWRARTSWRAQVEYSTIEGRNQWFWILARVHFYGRIFYLRVPRSARAPKVCSIWYSLINSIYPRYFQNAYIF